MMDNSKLWVLGQHFGKTRIVYYWARVMYEGNVTSASSFILHVIWILDKEKIDPQYCNMDILLGQLGMDHGYQLWQLPHFVFKLYQHFYGC